MTNNSVDTIQEVEQNFIDSSYDVNSNRAFPDVRDGLKPGARAILWTMYKNKFLSSKPHVKSAKIDGSVAANYWPHGTTAIYETFVHMSQTFGMNNPEVDFHGNNGNVIMGDVPASDRYTEARLSRLSEKYVLDGVDKDAVPMIDNYLEDEKWPKVMPSVFPNLLVNGTQGIGVGVATTVLPHNLNDTAELLKKYITDGTYDDSGYYPDFPTGGTIINKSDLPEINKTGKGKVILQARYETDGKKITFTEMPYQVYIEDVVDEIKDAIDQEKITNVTDVYNDSDRKRIALVVVVNRPGNVDSVLEQLFQNTHLRSQYNANQNVIVSKTPVLLNTRQIVDYYVDFNLECIQSEAQYDLEKVRHRLHIIEALLKAIDNIDYVVSTIRKSKSPAEDLKGAFGFDDEQVNAILGMRLSALSRLQSDSLLDEQKEKTEKADALAEIVKSKEEQKRVLWQKLDDMEKEFGSPRKTKVIQMDVKKTTTKKAKQVYDVVIEPGYMNGHVVRIKKGTSGDGFRCKSNDLINIIDTDGNLFRVSAEDINDDTGRGMVTSNLSLGGSPVALVLPNRPDDKKPYIVFGFKNGKVLKMSKENLVGTTRNLRGHRLVKGDVIGVIESNGDVIRLGTENGMLLDFDATTLRASKSGSGRQGIKLEDGDELDEISVIHNRSYIQGLGGKGRLAEYLK